MSKKQAKGKSSKRKILIILGVILLLVAALVAGLLVQRWMAGSEPPVAQNETGQPESTLPPGIEEIQNLLLNNNTEEANKRINEIVNNPSAPNDEKYMAYIQQGNEAANKQDYPKAIASYDQALAAKETYEIVRLLAETWQDAGDKTKAIEYFKKAKTLINPNSPMSETDTDLINQRIISLGGQP